MTKADPAASDARLSQIREELDTACFYDGDCARDVPRVCHWCAGCKNGWLLARLDTRERQLKSVLLSVRTTANQNYKIKAYGVAEALHYVADALEKLLK